MKSFAFEMIQKAKAVKTSAELLTLAKENGIEMTEEEAKAYFEQLNPKSGELSDDELKNVSGGGCYNKGRLVVTNFHSCDQWICEKCGGTDWNWERVHDARNRVHRCGGKMCDPGCANCKYMIYNGLQLCTHPSNCK
ncbi:MAG: Nif11-like leader peptide family RiPP precursor [Clostridia bacterium]|nr:Nif11-like leader peptide family RiPP precursor [Clostridia bacterium]